MTAQAPAAPQVEEQPTTVNSITDVSEIASMSLAEKLLRIEIDMPEIQKTGRNEKLEYDFVEQQTIMNAVRPLLQHYRVLVVPTMTNHVIKNKLGNDRATGAEINAGVKAIASLTFKFINIDQPADILEINWTAEGDDWGDKGTNKATTIAQKNMYIRLFNIADSDPDAEAPEGGSVAAPSKLLTKQKETNIYRMLGRLGMTVEDYETGLKKPVSKMTNQEADAAIELMQAAIERQLVSKAATE